MKSANFPKLLCAATLLLLTVKGASSQALAGAEPFPAKPAAGLSILPAGARAPISAALGKDDSGYWVHASANGFRGENRTQALSAEFTSQGAEVRSHDLSWRLKTQAYGYGNTLHALKPTAPQAKANRIEYRRDGITEWYENGPLGLEQGFTLARRPGKANREPLTLELELSGDLSAALQPATSEEKSKSLELRGKDGKAALRYTGIEARDATGRELRAWLEVRAERLLVRVDDKGAQYPVVVDPWIQEAELISSDGAANDEFGWSVAVDGNTIVVGAVSHALTGAAYVFVQSGGTWVQQAELIPSDGAAADEFGASVAVSGSTIVVGAIYHPYSYPPGPGPGAAYVFVESGGTWAQQAELTASDGAGADGFGNSVAVSGGTAVVGAPYHKDGSNTDQGAAYVFVQSGTSWSQQAELIAADGAGGDGFGQSVALSGTTAMVGAPSHLVGSNAGQGAAYVFVQSGTSWSQQAELAASDGAASDIFGVSVALSGTTAAAGAPGHTVGSNAYQGAAYVFAKSGTTWSQKAELTASDGTAYDYFGYTVGVSGSLAVVGAPRHMVGSNEAQGAAYAFAESAGTWSQQAELTASDGAAFDGFGISAALSGNMAVLGARNHQVGSNAEQGAAYLFEPTTTVTLTPGSLSFGSVAFDITSAAKMVMLKNTGTATLDIGSISIAPSANFTISNTTCGSTLAVNKTCKVSVTFSPSQLGPATATLSFSDNATGSPQTVALSGTGVAQATLTPAAVSFPTTKVGTTSTQMVTLKNNLPTPLTGISYSIAPPFGIAATSTCGTTLNSKASCVFKVTFSPTATGSATGTLTVTDSANNSPQTVSMEGDSD